MLKIGDKAPDFNVKDTNGNLVKLSDFNGKNIVLYFYPKDMTPGCTKEACNFKEDYKKYKDKDIVILGVSLDDEEMHKKFIRKYNLPFPLLCDVNADISKKYEVYQQKSFLGKKFMGIVRTTFIIDKNGFIKHIFPKVEVDGHSKEILDLFR